jgi:hypothetical protein
MVSKYRSLALVHGAVTEDRGSLVHRTVAEDTLVHGAVAEDS